MNPHLGPIDLANEIQCHLDGTLQSDHKEVATKFGISEKLVTELLRLLDLCEMAQERVNIGILDRTVALMLAWLPHAEQLRLLERATTSTSGEFLLYMQNDHQKVKANLAAKDKALALADRLELLLRSNTLQEVRKREGCTTLCILNRLALFDLIDDANLAFRDGRMDLSNACDLSRLPYKLQPYFVEAAIKMDSQAFTEHLISNGIQLH